MPASLSASTISGQISWWRRTYSSSYPGLTSKTHAYCAICPLAPSDFDELETEQARDLAQRASVVAYAKGAVVRRALLAPGVHERGWRQCEPEPAVGVSDPHRRSRQRLAFGREHLEVAFPGLGYAEDGDGSCLDTELNGDTIADLAMVDTEASEHRLLVADGDVPRTIMAHEDEVIVEVHGVELSERSTST